MNNDEQMRLDLCETYTRIDQASQIVVLQNEITALKAKYSRNDVQTSCPTYQMICFEGEYRSCSWIGLGWSILIHRLHHLWKDRKWAD